MKDPFAKERALIQSKKKEPEMGEFFKHLLAGLKGDLEPMIKANKGADGHTPQKGKDYFTDAEIEALKSEIKLAIPKGDKGDTPEVDYDLLFAYCTEQIAKIPKPKDGEPGKDAVIDTAYVISEVLKQVPKIETPTVNYQEIESYIDKKIKKIRLPEQRVVGYSSLRQLTDVILTGVPQDSKGNYILTPGGSGGGHIIEDEGTPLTQRDTLNFTGAGVTVTDAGGKTVVTIPGGGGGGAVDSVNGQTGVVVLDADDIDDTSTTHKFTTASDITKLAGIATGAEVNVNADWNAVSGDAQILNKPTIPTQYTDEQAQDAVGTILTDTTSVDLIYDDTGNTISAQREALTGAITAPKNSNTTALGSFTVAQLNTAISDADVATGGGTATGTNTGDQTTIVGITGTKAQFDTAVTDGNFLYVGDITQYTDELAQDAVGAMVATSIVYNDAGATLQRAALTGAITASQDSNTTALGSFTKAQLDTAVSDGNVMYIGDAPTAHTHLLAAGATDVTMTAANLNSLDDGVDSTLHFHATDRNRANHSGTQLASTISDFTEASQDAVGAMVDTTLTYVDGTPLLQRSALTGAVTASAGSNTTALGSFTTAQLNTALSDNDIATGGGSATGTNTGDNAVNSLYSGLVSNATHTGEVTGATALTVDKTAITNKTTVTPVAGDFILFSDTSDSGNLKKANFSDFGGGGGGSATSVYIDQTPDNGTYGLLAGTVNGSNAVFTVAEGAYTTGKLTVYLNGQLMTQGASNDYQETTPASGTFTFVTAPPTGSIITAVYQKDVTVSASIAGQATVDFGAVTTENSIARVTVNTGSVSTGSIVMVSPAGVATATHDPDDYQWDNISGYVSNIVNGVSFDLIATAPNGSFGTYVFNYVIN